MFRHWPRKIILFRFLKNDSVFNTIVPLLGEFCDIVIKSSLSDQAIKNQVAEARIRYITLIKNCFKKEYKELSEKYDKMYYSESIKLIQNEVLEIEPEHLVSLAKCALIEEKTNPNGSLVKEGIIGDFANFEEVVIKVYYLYLNSILSFEERKEQVTYNIQTIKDIISIIRENGFSR